MPNIVTEFSENGLAFIVQTENQTSAQLFDSNPRAILGRKSRKAALDLETVFGGKWTYVPGHGCRGGWTVETDSVEDLVALMERSNIPVTLFVYPNSDVSEVLWLAATERYALEGGYYSQLIECCHTESDHWRENTYGEEFRTNCDCPCRACREY